MRFISCITLLFLVNAIQCAKPKANFKCNESTRQKIDGQFSSVVPVLNGVKLPENEKHLQKFCASASIAMDSAFGYVKQCGGTFGPFLSKMALNEYNKGFNEICKFKDTRKVKEVLSAGRCVNSATAKLEKCAHYMIDSMMSVKDVPIEARMNTVCCQGHKVLSCTMRSLTKSKKCDKDIIKKIEKGWALGMGDMCGRYDSNKCSKLLNKIPKFNETYVRPKSIFVPMMTVMDSYRNMKCSAQNEQRMDSMLAQLLTIGTPDQIPENSGQLTQWCNKAFQSGPYFYGYIESCVSEFGKFLAKIMSGAMATNFQPYCGKEAKDALDSPNSEMQEYIKAAKCGNKAEDKIKVCFDKFNENLLSISEAPERSRIKTACCNAQDFRNCIFNATTSTKGCSLQTVQWAERQVMASAEGAINLICVDHWGGPKCDNLMKQLPALDKTKYIAPKSPFFPMIKMLDSFPEVELQKK